MQVALEFGPSSVPYIFFVPSILSNIQIMGNEAPEIETSPQYDPVGAWKMSFSTS